MTTTPGLLTVLVTSPRVPAGLLSRDAWTALESADQVLAADTADPVPAAVAASGIEILHREYSSPADAARELARRADGARVLWIGSPDADPGLTDALADELSRLDTPPQIEVLVGSWDQPGARLLDAVAVVDALRSPGGCPWDAQQTHESLTKYLLEEAHEAAEAIEGGDSEHLTEELGDVLFQVLFHARIAAEEDPGFDVDDVAATLVAKLVRRHPHVFADAEAQTPEQVEAQWEQIKAQEKSERSPDDLLAGIPVSLSTLLIAEKVLARMTRRGLPLPTAAAQDTSDAAASAARRPAASTEPSADLGAELLNLVAAAQARGESADAALRAELRRLAPRTS